MNKSNSMVRHLIVAGVGSRGTPASVLAVMEQVGSILATHGNVVKTGAAVGADQAFANGACSVNPKLVHLYLPWMSYNYGWWSGKGMNIHTLEQHPLKAKAFDSVARFHPAANRLSVAARKLHARNFLIIRRTSIVLYWTKGGLVVGGTGQALRIVPDLGIPTLWLQEGMSADAVIDTIASMKLKLY